MINNIMPDIEIDDSGVVEFIKLCRKGRFSKFDIIQLLENPSYENLIKLGGPNIGMETKEIWLDSFYNGFNAVEDNSGNMEAIDFDECVRSNIRKKISWSKSHLEEIEIMNKKVTEAVKKRDFLNIACNYIPDDMISLKKIKVSLLVFMDNAFGAGSDIIADAAFLGSLSEENISKILAHELHHMLRETIEKKYNINKNDIIYTVLSWLESEGIAGLCSFEATYDLYEKLGFAKKGSMDHMLLYTDNYLEKINDYMIKIFEGEPGGNELINYIAQNAAKYPVGYVMAKRIEDILGNSSIKRCAGHPLQFLSEYQRAAKASKDLKQMFIFDDSLINKIYNKVKGNDSE